MRFGINTTSDISKLLYVILKFWNITSGIYAKYHVQILLLFVYTTTRKRFVIFTCRYFILSWNTTALSQSNCRNFSCSSINVRIFYISNVGNCMHRDWPQQLLWFGVASFNKNGSKNKRRSIYRQVDLVPFVLFNSLSPDTN